MRWRHGTTRVVPAWCLVCLLSAWDVPGCGKEQAPRAPDTEVARSPIVVVFNGCGVPGSARRVAEALRGAGFDVGNGYGENADSFDYPKTLVVDYVGQSAEAQKVADFLKSPMVEQISHDPDRFGTVGVVVGADFRERLAQITGE